MRGFRLPPHQEAAAERDAADAAARGGCATDAEMRAMWAEGVPLRCEPL